MSGYIGTQPVPQATQTRDSFTCTAGQTSFATSGYTPNFLDVYLNGVKLTATDYTASNGSDVVLASGAATGDVLEVVAFTTFDVVTDTITAAGTALTLDRTGSDGTILDLKKNGSTVGSIGTVSSGLLVGSTDSALYFHTDNNIYPYNPSSSAYRNGDVDLGWSSGRFKDLYLSGGVYLGGTGSANKLDDYEEGTWAGTAVITSATSSSVTDETYTKIGQIVHVSFTVNFAGASGGLYVTGLPFLSSKRSVGIGREDATSGYGLFSRMQAGDTHVDIWYTGATGNPSPFQAGVSSGNFRISMTYHTNA